MSETTCPCLHCGGKKFRYYDGMLGYEAGICLACGFIYDHAGIHTPETDPQSKMYVQVDQEALATRLWMRNEAMAVHAALKTAVHTLNQIPRTGINDERFKNSYEVCSYLDRIIREIECAGKEVAP